VTTTADKLASGGAVVCWVLAIEGFDYLITNATDTGAVATAWAATDWSQVLGGLEVSSSFEQEIRPLDPQLDFSSATFVVHDGPDDTLGTSVYRAFKSTGATSPLTASATPASTTIDVLTTTDFADSGTVYVGPEAIGYGVTGQGDFENITRGRYAPFGKDGSTEWARSHNVSTTYGVPTFSPAATDWKRVWIGSHVGLWLHVIEDGVVNVKADAKLIFAGVLSDIADEIGALRLVATDFRSQLANTTLLNDQFSATIEEGVYVDENQILVIQASTTTTAPALSGEYIFIGPTEFGAPARLTAQEIIDIINAQIAIQINTADDIVASISADGRFQLTASWTGSFLSTKLGIATGGAIQTLLGARTVLKREDDGDTRSSSSFVDGGDETDPVLTLVGSIPMAYAQPTIGFGNTLTLRDPTGTFVDQSDTIPEPMRTDLQTASTGSFGFLRYDKFTFMTKRVSDTEFLAYWDNNVLDLFEQEPVGHVEDIVFPVVRYNEEPPRVRQVLCIAENTADFLIKTFASTGASAYNEATYDAYARQLGAAVPWSLLGDGFVESARSLAESGPTEVTVLLEEPTTIADILAPELALRNSHLVFRDDGLRFVRYSGEAVTPDHLLSDSDLSAPPDRAQDERPESWWSKDFLVNAVKIKYDRSVSGDYKSIAEVVNTTSQGEYGSFPVTISARNTLSRGEAGKDSLWVFEVLERIGADVLATFDEPVQFVRMSVQGSKVFGIAPGDTVGLTSDWIRYSLTGARGVAGVIGVVTQVSYDLGDLDGQVTMMLTGGELARAAEFSPAALVDSDYAVGGFSGGYDSGQDLLKLEQHQFSASAEAKDITRFTAGDKVRIIERSPATPGSPQSWDAEVTDTVDADDELEIQGTTLTGFDTTKQYYVISDVYGTAVASQQAQCYFADLDDDKIDGTDQSKTFRLVKECEILFDLLGDSAGPYEFPPTDGQWSDPANPLHPAEYQALAANINHIVGSRTAPENPGVVVESSTSSDPDGALVAVFYWPIGHSGAGRTIRVGPRFRSNIGVGASIGVRSSSNAPNRVTNSITIPTMPDAQEVTFTTTSSSFVNATSKSLPVVFDNAGGTWITVVMDTSSPDACHFAGFHTFYTEEI